MMRLIHTQVEAFFGGTVPPIFRKLMLELPEEHD